jgi:acetyl esterase/lipase
MSTKNDATTRFEAESEPWSVVARGITRRELALGALATSVFAGALPRAATALAAGQEARDPLWFVDPELRPAARQVQQMFASISALSEESLPAMRQSSAMAQPPAAGVPFSERAIAGGKGGPEVRIYVVNAKPGAARGGILHTHGGGYVLGAAKSAIGSLQQIAAELDCAIVTVDYRLAPETRWAGSVEDNYAGLRWLHEHADEIGVDRSRLAVMGESAGGGHAALLAIAARDRGEVPLAFQCLVYPMLDDRTGSTRQVPETVGTLLWTAESNRFGWRSFLGEEPGGPSVAVAAVPARVENLAGLPPAWIGVGSIDLFVEEDIDYTRRLIAAGVGAELLVVPGAFHGFDLIAADTSVAKRFNAAKLEALRRALAAA